MINFDQIDRTIHEKGRLAIMTLLASRADWSFQDLKAELKMSDGNLITHLRTLEKKGYVSMARAEEASRRRTLYALTRTGDRAFRQYLAILEAIVNQTKPSS